MNWNNNSTPLPRATFYRKIKKAKNISNFLDREERLSDEDCTNQDLNILNNSYLEELSNENESNIENECVNIDKNEDTSGDSDDEDDIENDIFFSDLIQQFSEEEKSKMIYEGIKLILFIFFKIIVYFNRKQC